MIEPVRPWRFDRSLFELELRAGLGMAPPWWVCPDGLDERAWLRAAWEVERASPDAYGSTPRDLNHKPDPPPGVALER